MPPLPPEAMTYVHLGIKAMALINEMGAAVKIDGDTVRFVFGMRTAFGNPPDVIAKLIAIDPDLIMAGKAGEVVKPILAGAPSAPLAQDVKAGYMGLMLPTMGIGMLSAIAIPTFMEYMKKGKKSEASLQLNKLGKNLKTYYIENAAFPVGDAPLTPSKLCCGQPSNKCAVDPDGWKQEIWQKLDFQIDEPNLYRFSYHSDGKTAQVRAQGDADCDGNEATFTLDVTTENGNPMAVITPPPTGVY
jgi:Tfp pilus assembly protein PilE